ncbi:galactose-3-o-sulfotransferase 3 [Plakobranchus ocellatus]|uniref:Galactose-3-o-sulfotransferase 3 n=1 Tax=Plakobranchus ocellatus TaxID=259542 RepID=A0AAV4B0Y1_9GAST|nr:galactose-3-o-sulfotransferase 3 [Plakobranchus ocellatus]
MFYLSLRMEFVTNLIPSHAKFNLNFISARSDAGANTSPHVSANKSNRDCFQSVQENGELRKLLKMKSDSHNIYKATARRASASSSVSKNMRKALQEDISYQKEPKDDKTNQKSSNIKQSSSKGKPAAQDCILNKQSQIANNSKAFQEQSKQFQQDTEIHQVVFAKVHKAASSTLQNILLRFALSRNLNVILSKLNGHILSEVRSKISPSHIMPRPGGQPYHMLCSHVIYNEKEIGKFFPDSVFRVAIIREPMNQALSALQYYTRNWPSTQLKRGLRKYPKDPNNGFLRHPEHFYNPANNWGPAGSYINNRMSIDLGFDQKNFDASKRNQTKIKSFLKRLDNEFDMVLICDMFDESMVLLRRYLKWPMKDIIYIKVNAAKQENNSVWRHKPILNTTITKSFRQWDAIDYALYEHFLPIFLKKIKSEVSFQEEVKVFKTIQKKVSEFCLHDQTDQNLSISKNAWTNEFNISRSDCKLMMQTERSLTSIVRQKQTERYQRYLKSRLVKTKSQQTQAHP